MFVKPESSGGTAIVSDLANARSLKLHAVCHGLAFTVLVVAILLDNATVARFGSTIGLIGALAFAWFTADVIRRMPPLTGQPRDRAYPAASTRGTPRLSIPIEHRQMDGSSEQLIKTQLLRGTEPAAIEIGQ
jgi:hypothetical protein